MASWVGRGGGRSASQPSLNIQGGPGQGGGRLRGQVNINTGPNAVQRIQTSFGYTNNPWAGRGGGRHPYQPALKPATGHENSPNNWSGRGGGRAGIQPTLKPANGRNMSNWVGRGGGRSAYQPTIASASIISAQRAMLGAASNMVAGAMGGTMLGSLVGAPTMARELEDPMGSYVFALEVNGMEVAHFTECSGIKSSTEIYEVREGGMNHAVHKLPGQSTWDNITLKYGVTSDMSMLGLREYILNDEYAGGGSSSVDLGSGLSSNTSLGSMVHAGLSMLKGNADPSKMKNKRFSGSIVLKNNRMQEMVRYTFQQAWIVSWEGPKLNSEGSDLAVESIEIAHHGVSVSRSYVTKVPAGWV